MQEQQKGVLDIGQDNTVQAFREKSINDGAIINAGYMVLEPEVFDTISGDDTIFEQTPLRELAAKGQLMSYVKKVCWKKCGRLAVRPGKCGTNNELGILPRQTRVCNRAYRF